MRIKNYNNISYMYRPFNYLKPIINLVLIEIVDLFC